MAAQTKNKPFLQKIYMENIWRYKNSWWELKNDFTVLSGGDFVEPGRSTTEPLLKLIGMVCEGEIDKGILSEYFCYDDKKPAVLVLKEVSGDSPVIYQGIFGSLGSTYIFKKNDKLFEFQNITNINEVYRMTLDEGESSWKDDSNIIVGCLMKLTKSTSAEERNRFSIEAYTKCVFENQSYGQLNDGKVSLYHRQVKIKNSKVCDMEDNLLPEERRKLVEYCKFLEQELNNKSGPIVTMVNDERLDVSNLSPKLKGMVKTLKVQVILVTDRRHIRTHCLKTREQECADYEMFITKCWYDGLLNTVGFMPFALSGKSVNFTDKEMVKELIILVEGKEDIFIVEALIKLLIEQLESGQGDRLKELEFKDYEKETKMALLMMLRNVCVFSIEGKGNLSSIQRYFKFPIPYVIIIDEDAIYVDAAAKDVQQLSDECFLPAKCKSKEITPVASKKWAPIFSSLDYSERISLQSELEQRMHCKQLTIALYKEKLESCNIFTWDGGDGTSSGAFKLNKGDVISQGRDDLTKHIEEKIKTKDKGPSEDKGNKKAENIPLKNVLKFKEFLLKRTFKHYLKFFGERLLGKDCPERQTYRVSHHTNDSDVTINVVRNKQSTVPDHEIEEILTKKVAETSIEIKKKTEEFEKLIDRKSEEAEVKVQQAEGVAQQESQTEESA